MINAVKTTTLAATVSLMALSSAAFATDMPMASEINVSASFDAAEGSNAQELFPEITSDVGLAIAERVKQSDDAADPIIRVDIRKVALDGDTMLPGSKEFNELEGVVSIDTNTGKGGQSFPVAIKAMMDDDAVPAGAVALSPSLDDFYGVMVNAFADQVAEEFAHLNMDGLGTAKQ